MRTAKTLMIHTPKPVEEVRWEISCLVVLLNVKAVATHQALFPTPGLALADEFRDMTRLYLRTAD